MLKHYLCIGALLLQVVNVYAREPYHTTIVFEGSENTVSAPNLVDLTRDLRETVLTTVFPTYTPTAAIALDYNLRGIQTIASFAENSPVLNVFIPQTGQTEVFAGETRDESLVLFKDYIRDAGRQHKLLRAYSKYSPIDPIAGNPNSLLSNMGQADYNLGRLTPTSGCDPSWNAQPITHLFQGGTKYCRAFPDDYETTAVILPLRYSYSPDGEWAFIIDAPAAFNENGGASSLLTSLGVALRVPLTCDWSVTPTMRYGAGGSFDLCTGGNFASAGLVSEYNFKICDYVLSMTNYAGYFSSMNLWLSGINFNYHLHNWIFKNGLTLTACHAFCLCDRSIDLNVSFTDSAFAGSSLFMNHYDEIGFAIITTGINPQLNYDCLSLGFAYQFGEKHFNSYSFDLIYQF